MKLIEDFDVPTSAFRLLVGEGAYLFAKERGLPLVENVALISEAALKKYKKYKERLKEAKNTVTNKLEITIRPSQSQVNSTNFYQLYSYQHLIQENRIA